MQTPINHRALTALTYLAFAALILAAHGCGKDNKSGKGEKVKNRQNRAYLECSRASTWAYCTGGISNKLLRPKDFYDYYCYEDYKACLNSHNYGRN